MERSIFGFIWKYSKRQQLVILALSIVLLPLNYYSYDIPKQIINKALGSGRDAGVLRLHHGPASSCSWCCAACSWPSS